MFNVQNIPQIVLDETFRGIESEVTSLADVVCTRVEVADLAGILPTAPSINSLAQLKPGLPEGAEPSEKIMDFTSTNYNCLRYVGLGVVTDGVRMSLEAMNYAPLEVLARSCRQTAGSGIDGLLNTVLSSAALNTAQAAGAGVWSNPASTPLDDIQAATRANGHGDLMVLGNNVAFFLQEHPDFVSRFSNFSGGAISEGELVNTINNIWPWITKVIVGGRMYNSANPSAAATVAFQFDDLAWCGHSSDLVLTEMGAGRVETQRDLRREAEEVLFSRRCDIVRPHQEMGVVITGVA